MGRLLVGITVCFSEGCLRGWSYDHGWMVLDVFVLSEVFEEMQAKHCIRRPLATSSGLEMQLFYERCIAFCRNSLKALHPVNIASVLVHL